MFGNTNNAMSCPVFEGDLKPITMNVAHCTGMMPQNDNHIGFKIERGLQKVCQK